MILLNLFWRTSLFVASLYYSFSIHLVFNALSFFCRSPNCHISPQLPPLGIVHPPSLYHLPNSPVPLLHPVPTTDHSSSLRSILPCHYSLFCRQYEALRVTVREVLLSYALIQPTLRWFSPFHQLSPTHFFLCSCTIWLIKVIPTPSF